VSETVESSEPNSRLLLQATWDDAPHLTELEKRELLRSIPEFQREARTRGVPYLGSGLIFPFDEKDIRCEPFTIPKEWPRGFGFDVGWNRTAACHIAHDRQTDILYLYHAYSRGMGEPPSHASAIKALGPWVPGRIDPASRGRSQIDGQKLIKLYTMQGLKLQLAPNAVEAGILAIYTRLSTGKLKVFKTCHSWFEEFRVYQRDDDGKVVKENDHCMDATRYFVLACELEGFNWLKTEPVEKTVGPRYQEEGHEEGWMVG
jgi:hypothetical protein